MNVLQEDDDLSQKRDESNASLYYINNPSQTYCLLLYYIYLVL